MTRKKRPPDRSGDPAAGRNSRAIGIVRVSTTKQRDGNSPEVQRNGIELYAESRGLELASVIEIHESAKDSDERPEFNAALTRVKREGVGHVLFWVQDRVGRNMTDPERLEKEVRRGRFVLHIAAEQKVFHQATPDGDWLAADFCSLTAKQYSRDLSRRAKEAMDRKAERGVFPTRPPLGYINVRLKREDGTYKDRGGTIELAPWGKPLIRRMYELRVRDGQSLVRINDIVLEEGLVPPHKVRAFRSPGKGSRIQAILTNTFYVGTYEWRGRVYDGTHQTIFTSEEWDRLQATFDARPAPKRTRVRQATFAGFLRCAECGCQITYDPKRKGDLFYPYYRCADGRRWHDKLTYVTESAILDGLASAVDSIDLDGAMAELIAEALNAGHEEVRAERRAQASGYRRALGDLEEREDQLYEDLRGGRLDERAYRRQLGRVREDRARFTTLLEQANEELDTAYLVTARRVLELASQAKKLWASRSAAEKRELLEAVVSNPRLRGRSVEYDLQKPFRILSEMAEDPEWRAQQDSNLRPPVP